MVNIQQRQKRRATARKQRAAIIRSQSYYKQLKILKQTKTQMLIIIINTSYIKYGIYISCYVCILLRFLLEMRSYDNLKSYRLQTTHCQQATICLPLRLYYDYDDEKQLVYITMIMIAASTSLHGRAQTTHDRHRLQTIYREDNVHG